MITKTGLGSGRWAKAEAAYERWEYARSARFIGWSTRRRWGIFVLVPTLVFCCGGTGLGVPITWVFRETIEAGRGAPSPDAAADDYLMALGYNNTEGLLPILDNDHQDKLMAEWNAYRKAMDTSKPPPSRLDFGALTVGPNLNGLVEVTADVSAAWWGIDGRALAFTSEKHTWRFRTREHDGWRVVAVGAPAWCGGYVRLEACA